MSTVEETLEALIGRNPDDIPIFALLLAWRCVGAIKNLVDLMEHQQRAIQKLFTFLLTINLVLVFIDSDWDGLD